MDVQERMSMQSSGTGSRSRRRRRRAHGEAPIPLDKVLLALLCALVWGSLLAIGSVHLGSQLVIGALATIGAVLSFAGGRLSSVPPPAVVTLLLAVYTSLQALPMPLSWVAALSPAAADTWSRSLLPFGEHAPEWAALSLAPRSSLVEALKWWTYSCVFVVAAAVSRTRGPKTGIAVVFVSGTLAAAVTLAHGLLGSTEVFGVYEPKFVPRRWAVGPLLNPNNLSGYLNLAIFCGVGMLLGNAKAKYRSAIAFGMVVLIATSLLAASRGGVIGLLLGSILLVPIGLWLRRRRAALSVRTLGALGLFAALGLGLALIGATRETWSALYDANAAKLELAAWTKPMIKDHPLFGVGRGAFETVLPAYHADSGNTSYTHPENFLAQWATEWGLVVTVLAVAALGWIFRGSRLQVRRSMTALCALVGVLALLAQNLVDLALEVPAVVIALAVVLNSLLKEDAVVPGRAAAAPRLVVATALLGAVFVLAAVGLGTRGVVLVRRALHDAYVRLDVRNDAQRAGFVAELRRQMARFPAEPYLPLLGALVAWRTNGDTLPWLNRALERDQSAGRAHFLLANVLARKGAKSQALMELRLAIEGDPTLAFRAGQLAVDWTRNTDQLLRAVPAGKLGVEPLLVMGKRLSGREHDEFRETLLGEAMRRDPDSSRVLLAYSTHLFEALATGVPRCRDAARAKCFATLASHARRLERIEPRSFAATEVSVKALIAQGQPELAAQKLDQPCFDFSDPERCLRLRITTAVQMKDHETLAQATKDYASSSCSSPHDCARISAWIGNYLSKHGFFAEAITHLERAAREEPSVQRWLAVADCAEVAGATGRQINALQHVQRLPGGRTPAIQQRVSRAMTSSTLFMLKKAAPAGAGP